MIVNNLTRTFGFFFLCGLLLQSCGSKPAAEPLFQNVVVIISDDHAQAISACYGNDYISGREEKSFT